jgi:hypothetical protein
MLISMSQHRRKGGLVEQGLQNVDELGGSWEFGS